MPIEHFFVQPNDDNAYCIFQPALEDDPLVWFHGTAKENLESITTNGFRPKPPLESVTFASKSSGALKYACDRRTLSSPEGVVIVGRFVSLAVPGICGNDSVVDVYLPGAMPTIIGYCIVPAEYAHR